MNEDEIRCPLFHRDDNDRPRRATVGLLCQGHARAVDQALDELGRFDTDADDASYAETVSVSLSAPTTGSKSEPLPINAQRTEHVSLVRERLANWVRLLSKRYEVKPPLPTIKEMAAWLLHYNLWTLADSDDAKDYAEAILELARRARSLVNPSRTRRVPCGPCRETVADENGDVGPCDGEVSAIVRGEDELLPSSIRCASCGFEVPAHQWMSFGRVIVKAREAEAKAKAEAEAKAAEAEAA